MAIPDIQIKAEADVGTAVKNLDRYQKELGEATRATDKFATASAKTQRVFDTTQRAFGEVPRKASRTSAAFSRLTGVLSRVRNSFTGLRRPMQQTVTGLDNVNRSAGRNRFVMQNVAFQVGDFATQVGAGTAASIALGQQLPQLLGAFGAFGAVAGTVAAIVIPLTRAMGALGNSGKDVTAIFGELQPVAQAIGRAFSTIASSAQSFGVLVIENLDRILITAGTVAAFFAGKWVTAFVAARVATFSLAGALVTLRTALIRTGIGALIVGVGELIFQFTRLVRATGGIGDALVVLKDLAVDVWNRIRQGVSALGAKMAAVFFDFKADAASAIQAALKNMITFANNAVNTFEGAFAAVKEIWGRLPDLIGSIAFQAANALIGGVENMINGLISRVNGFIDSINSVVNLLPDRLVGDTQLLANIGEVDFGGINNPYEGAAEAAGTAASAAFNRAFEDSPFSTPDFGLSGISSAAREEAQFFQQAFKDLSEGATLPLESIGKIQALLQRMRDEGLDVRNVLLGGGDGEGDGQKTVAQELEEEEKQISASLKRITDLTKGSFSDRLGAASNYFSNLASLTGTNNKKLLGLAKAFAASQALIDAWSAHNRVLADPTLPWFARVASAVQVLAAGLGAVNAIRSISDSGSGASAGAGGGGGAGGGATGGATAAPDNDVFINANLVGEGPIRRSSVLAFIDQLNDAIDDGATIRGITVGG